MKKKFPTTDEIKALREAADLTQAEAAELLYISLNTWTQWERGARKMHPAFYELFMIKSEQIKDIKVL